MAIVLNVASRLGYYQPREKDILDFLDGKDYDLKLLSVHHNGVNDYLDDEVAVMDKASIIQRVSGQVGVRYWSCGRRCSGPL